MVQERVERSMRWHALEYEISFFSPRELETEKGRKRERESEREGKMERENLKARGRIREIPFLRLCTRELRVTIEDEESTRAPSTG